MSRPISQSHKTGHRYALTRLSSYMDGELTAREKTRVKAYLDTCPDCRIELRALRWTRDLTRQMPVLPVPRSFIVREADLEPRGIAQPRPRFARSLAGLQAAAAVVAVLLVLVVAGDLFVGTGFPINQAAPAVARQTLDTETITMPVSAAPESMLDKTVVGQPAQEPDAQPEQMLLVAPEETLAQPPVEPSPTTIEFTGEGTSTKRSSTPQPEQTATIAPTATLTLEAKPTTEPVSMAAPKSTAGTTPALESQQIADMPQSMTRVWIEAEEDPGGNPTPSPAQTRQRLGWRVAQAGLGIVLIGLMIAIVWLRLKRRTG